MATILIVVFYLPTYLSTPFYYFIAFFMDSLGVFYYSVFPSISLYTQSFSLHIAATLEIIACILNLLQSAFYYLSDNAAL